VKGKGEAKVIEAAAKESIAVDLDHSIGKRPRSFLRDVMADVVEELVRIPPRKSVAIA
jgi:hypothetical protein